MEKQIQKIRQKIKFNRGSILAVSLIILGLMLVSALSFSLVSIQERKASIGENISNQAYNKAETGVEKVMQAIKDNATLTVDKLAAAISGVTCTDGALVGTDGFKVQLKDANDAVIDCSTTADVALVRSVKSIGTAGGNQRAVEVAVALGGECEFVTVGKDCQNNYDDTVYCAPPASFAISNTLNKLCQIKKGNDYYAVSFEASKSICGAWGVGVHGYPTGDWDVDTNDWKTGTGGRCNQNGDEYNFLKNIYCCPTGS